MLLVHVDRYIVHGSETFTALSELEEKKMCHQRSRLIL